MQGSPPTQSFSKQTSSRLTTSHRLWMIMKWELHMFCVARLVSLLIPWFSKRRLIDVEKEWLPSLPLHLDLYAALQLPAPQYGHLPILLNPDGTKMSKRKGDVAVGDYMVRATRMFIADGSLMTHLLIFRNAAGSLTRCLTGWHWQVGERIMSTPHLLHRHHRHQVAPQASIPIQFQIARR